MKPNVISKLQRSIATHRTATQVEAEVEKRLARFERTLKRASRPYRSESAISAEIADRDAEMRRRFLESRAKG
jgi:hypothetical protein